MTQNPKYFVALLAAIPAQLAWMSHSAAEGDIIVAAPETEAIVAPRAPDSKLVNLPPLSFELRAAFRCKGEPASLTLSVADTYRTLGADVLAGQRAAELTLTVPPQQLPLAADSRFCIAGDAETTDRLLVPGLVTVHASLRCEGPEGASVHYGSAPLKARLLCAREPEPQDESASSAAR